MILPRRWRSSRTADNLPLFRIETKDVHIDHAILQFRVLRLSLLASEDYYRSSIHVTWMTESRWRTIASLLTRRQQLRRGQRRQLLPLESRWNIHQTVKLGVVGNWLTEIQLNELVIKLLADPPKEVGELPIRDECLELSDVWFPVVLLEVISEHGVRCKRWCTAVAALHPLLLFIVRLPLLFLRDCLRRLL